MRHVECAGLLERGRGVLSLCVASTAVKVDRQSQHAPNDPCNEGVGIELRHHVKINDRRHGSADCNQRRFVGALQFRATTAQRPGGQDADDVVEQVGKERQRRNVNERVGCDQSHREHAQRDDGNVRCLKAACFGKDAWHDAVARHRKEVTRDGGDGGVHGGEVAAEGNARCQKSQRQPQDAGCLHGIGIGCLSGGQRGEAFHRRDGDQEPLEKRVDRKHDKGCQKERARNIDARVLDFFTHGDARFKTRKAPPDHADACRKTHLSVFGQKRRCLYERGEIDVGDHGEKPNHRYAPEKEHKTVLQSPGNFDAADVGDDEAGGDDNGNGDIGKRQRDAKRRKQRLEVVAESESFSTRDGH